jgi:ABC-type glycerol-3-phosphate transport system substrate-binding protein
MKRLLLMLLAAVFIASPLIAGGGGQQSGSSGGPYVSRGTTPAERVAERYPQPVTVTAVLGYRPSENPNSPSNLTPETATAVRELREKLNINLQYSWVVNADQFDAKFGAEFAAGNLPDIMYLPPNTFEDLYQQGAFADLTEAYNLYATPGIKNVVDFDGQLINAGKRNGRLYGLPMARHPAQVTSQMYYRMDLLRQYGINSYNDLPKTIPEFEALADRILAATGRPVMPACQQLIDTGLSDFSPFFHAYEAWPGDGWVNYGNGTLEYAALHANVREALTKLNEWYRKGYFPRDFAAVDVWGAASPAVENIVAGQYAIVPGSWWIPNWPLNMNVANEPNAEWIVGPTLTRTGTPTKIQVPRYSVDNIVAVSRNCRNPEAIFKMMNWEIEFINRTESFDFERTATAAERLAKNSHVYFWVPWRIYVPTTMFDNFNFIRNYERQNIFDIARMDMTNAPNNDEIQNAVRMYIKYHQGRAADPETWPATWGFYTSRMSPNGGVARMKDMYENLVIQYDEAMHVTTASMITRQSILNDYKRSTFIGMIMGDVPISDFNRFITEWNNLGGNDIRREVNQWFATQR